MDDNQVEDILGGDRPEDRLREAQPGAAKRLATRMFALLRTERPKSLNPSERSELWNRIEQSTARPIHTSRSPRLLRFIAAASVLAAASVSFWLLRNERQPPLSSLALTALTNQSLLQDTGAIKLRGHDAHTIVVNDEGAIDMTAVDRDHGAPPQANQFNTLTVPYGKRKELILPDGSKVWLNAGSQLTFPERFEAEKREVYLEGEGYFDVQHNAKAPFFVRTEDFLVKVLGTAFNISSYHDDTFASTVLIRGKITLEGIGNNRFEPRPMEPGNTAVLERGTKRLLVHPADAEDYISWTRKHLILKQTPRSELLVKLGRAYNTKIVEAQPAAADDTFSGRLDLTQPLVDLLAIIYNQQEYRIRQEERRVIIQKK